MYKILIVEDDLTIAAALKAHIEAWGYEVQYAKDFYNILNEFASFSPQMVLLDISLPYYNGFHWCAEIRKISKVPIIFISSAADNMNIVMAITGGADDFIPKPFDLNVLTAKIQALMRRTYDFAGQSSLMEHKGAILDTAASTLTYEGKRTELTKNELRILQTLFENKGRVVTREDIMKRLWDSDSFVDDNTLTVNVNRLRKKLSDMRLDFIVTIKGVGYMVK